MSNLNGTYIQSVSIDSLIFNSIKSMNYESLFTYCESNNCDYNCDFDNFNNLGKECVKCRIDRKNIFLEASCKKAQKRK